MSSIQFIEVVNNEAKTFTWFNTCKLQKTLPDNSMFMNVWYSVYYLGNNSILLKKYPFGGIIEKNMGEKYN